MPRGGASWRSKRFRSSRIGLAHIIRITYRDDHIRQLRYLEALAQHRHFGRAAEACPVTSRPLHADSELERELKIDLVERRAGSIELTETGWKWRGRGERVLAAARDLVDFPRRSGRLLSGNIKLGIIPTLAPYVCRSCCGAPGTLSRAASRAARDADKNPSRRVNEASLISSSWLCRSSTQRSRRSAC